MRFPFIPNSLPLTAIFCFLGFSWAEELLADVITATITSAVITKREKVRAKRYIRESFREEREQRGGKIQPTSPCALPSIIKMA
ncbi:MAG: hypothetical protein COA78_05275 [Blastopirellula sp.]|nr:MAG: hypothetical protein COA78_05275 [Blastopirellula sp.]